MNAVPTCSVVVPIYRHAAYLRECLDSVFAQSHPDIELILIDDASPDDSFEIAQQLSASPRYRARFRRIVCEQNAVNSGAHHSLNRGIGLATGGFVFLLNSDDRYHPARLARMVEEMRAQPSGFAFSAVNPICGPGGKVHEGLLHIISYLDHLAPGLPSLSFAFLRYNCALSTGNFVIRRDVLDRVGPFVDLRLAHDWDFALRVIALAEPLYVPEPLYDYRLHPENTFTAVADRGLLETAACLNRYFQTIARGPVPNPLAPSPHNWPFVFEHYLELWDLEPTWRRISSGRVSNSRTMSAIRPRPELATVRSVQRHPGIPSGRS